MLKARRQAEEMQGSMGVRSTLLEGTADPDLPDSNTDMDLDAPLQEDVGIGVPRGIETDDSDDEEDGD